MLELHMAGFFRAVGSAIDCVGGAIVGVLGLKDRLLKSDFGRTASALQRATGGSQQPPPLLLAEFRDFLHRVDEESGPSGWREWATQMRNMLVHRGRRTHMFATDVDPAAVLSPAGTPFVRLRPRWYLPRSPALSEVEEMVTAGGAQGLTIRVEHAKAMAAVMGGVVAFAERICKRLSEVWQTRRENPSLIVQPAEQWGKFPSAACPGFGLNGAGFDAGGAITSPEIALRISAAAVDDARRDATWSLLLAGSGGSGASSS